VGEDAFKPYTEGNLPPPGLLGFLAGFIWFMNSKWSWQEVFSMLDSLWSVLFEGA
jgi:hypothetical protein